MSGAVNKVMPIIGGLRYKKKEGGPSFHCHIDVEWIWHAQLPDHPYDHNVIQQMNGHLVR